MAQTVKNLPTMWETQVQSLGGEDPLEKGMATHSRMFGKFHGQRSLAGYNPWGHKTEQLTHTVVNIQTLIYTLLFTLLLKLFGVPENKALSCVLNKSTFLYYNNIAPGRAPCVTAVSH